MKSRLILLTFALLVLTVGLQAGVAAPSDVLVGPHTILIIRHGEKPDETDGVKDPNLSKRGFERADALAKAIPNHFPKPDFLIATKKSKGSIRPIETLTPLAKALHEPIDSTFKDDEFADLAKTVLSDPKYAGKTVLIAWHHGKIPELAHALGATDAPSTWDANVFDRVWELTFKNGKTIWKDLPQNALPGDSCK